ncbi:MAG: hypothetical protein V4792_16600, partial [Pseudomonadota bacterium]
YVTDVADTTLDDLAAGLAAVVDAAAGYGATSAGAVVTVTASTVNLPFTYSASVIAHSVSIAAAITQEAS